MMQYVVIGVHDDHHDQIHQYGFKHDRPEETGAQYPLFFNNQEPDQKADKSAKIVQKHKVDMLGLTAYSSFVHVFTCFPKLFGYS